MNDLPDGEVIVLSIDCDWFSCSDPFYSAGRQEILDKIDEIISTLRAKNIRIAALNIATSPGYTTAGEEEIIKHFLLEAFAGYYAVDSEQ